VKKWDVFISHASEDKQIVAMPLTEALVRAGLKVWLDRFELKIGDSLREKIDEGLSESAFGVVILSKHFFSKGWPQRELNGLFAIEEDGTKVILPVWHGVDKTTVAHFSPILADRLAADTRGGIPALAQAIAQVVLDDSRRRSGTSLARQFTELLAHNPSPESVASFLAARPTILQAALGHFGLFPDSATLRLRPTLNGIQPDLAVGNLMSTAGLWGWRHFLFGPADGSLSEHESTTEHWGWRHFLFGSADGPLSEHDLLIGFITKATQNMGNLLAWVDEHAGEAARILLPEENAPSWRTAGTGDLRHYHEGIIVAGRRDSLSTKDKTHFRVSRDGDLSIRSYDWLVEASVVSERANT
jgi:hypothetical protein